MLPLAVLAAASLLRFQQIPISRPLKEGESYQMTTFSRITVGAKKVVENGKFEHKCTEVDDHDIQHIEATCIEGTKAIDDEEPESTKGEYYNYFQNAFGQRFEYEDIRVTLKDDPVGFMIEEIHAKLKSHAVSPGETWSDKTAHTTYTVMVGQTKKLLGTDCLYVIRKGKFTDGISGEFREESYYRVGDGQLIYRESSATNVVAPELEPIQFYERNEFVRPEK